MPSQEQKPSRIDRLLKAGVLLNAVTVPLWIILGRLDIALLDIGAGVVTEGARKKIANLRKGRNKISSSRMALVN